MITSDGQTYEKDLLLSHFKTNGPIDPMTRKNIGNKALYANNNIKELSHDWKLKNSYGGVVMENDYRKISLA